MSPSQRKILKFITLSGTVFGALCCTLVAALFFFGLPKSGEAKQHYLNKFCLLAKEKLDSHLPCYDREASYTDALSDRDALWSVVDTLCKPLAVIGVSFPCLKVDFWNGFAVLRAPYREQLDFLVTPTKKIEGVESAKLLDGDAPLIFSYAWGERGRLSETTSRHLGWRDVVLAVNSKETRSQDQLHVHLGCVAGGVRDYFFKNPTLGSKQAFGTTNWQAVHLDALNANFFVKQLPADGLRQNIFKMIIREIPGAKTYASQQTVAVLGLGGGSITEEDDEKTQHKNFMLLVSLERAGAEGFLARGC